MNRFASIALVALSVFAAPLLVCAAGDRPDATISLSGRTVAVGVGFSHANGTLQYGGKSYPVELDGIGAVSAGASDFSATGDVYHLAKLDDLKGSYSALSAGATLGDGETDTTLQNQNGVVIRLRSENKGLHFNLSVEGVSLKLAQ